MQWLETIATRHYQQYCVTAKHYTLKYAPAVTQKVEQVI